MASMDKAGEGELDFPNRFPDVANFVVKDTLHLSDYSHITTWLNINIKTSYTSSMMKMNPKKTKIMPFQKRARKMMIFPFL